MIDFFGLWNAIQLFKAWRNKRNGMISFGNLTGSGRPENEMTNEQRSWNNGFYTYCDILRQEKPLERIFVGGKGGQGEFLKRYGGGGTGGLSGHSIIIIQFIKTGMKYWSLHPETFPMKEREIIP